MNDQEMDNSDISTVDDDDDPLEYLTPPPPPLPTVVAPPLRGSDYHGVGVGEVKTLSTPHEADILIQTQSTSNSEGVQEVALLHRGSTCDTVHLVRSQIFGSGP
jgi:hypothetical protein